MPGPLRQLLPGSTVWPCFAAALFALANPASALQGEILDTDRGTAQQATDRPVVRPMAGMAARHADETGSFELALDLRPGFAEFYVRLARQQLEKGEIDEAFASFDKAFELTPQDDDLYIARGEAYMSIGRLDEAIADFTRATELRPENVDAWTLRTRAHLARGEKELALADFKQALAVTFSTDTRRPQIERWIAELE